MTLPCQMRPMKKAPSPKPLGTPHTKAEHGDDEGHERAPPTSCAPIAAPPTASTLMTAGVTR